jgi:hypothetical protein
MEIKEIIIYSYLGVLLVGIGIIIFAGIPVLIDELSKHLNRTRFSTSFKQAYKINPPDWEHVQIMLKQNRLGKKCQKLSLEKILYDSLTLEDEHSKEKIKYIDSLIDEIKKDEPFEGLPDNVRIHLEHIRTFIGEKAFDLQPLTNELRDISIKRARENKFNKVVSVISVILGLAGMVIGFYNGNTPQQTLSLDSNTPPLIELPNDISSD